VSGVTLSDQPVRPSVWLRCSQVAALSLPRGSSWGVRLGIPYELEVVLISEELPTDLIRLLRTLLNEAEHSGGVRND
jgi:hypothetical protein